MNLVFIYNNGKTFTAKNVVAVETEQRKGIAISVTLTTSEHHIPKFAENTPRLTSTNGIEFVEAIEVAAFKNVTYKVDAKESGLAAVILNRSPEFGDDCRTFTVIPFRGFAEGETPIKIDELVDGIIWSQGFPQGLHVSALDIAESAK